MYRFFIALRYLRRKRINFLAMIGVAVGVMVLFIVHSVMTGFGQEIRTRIRGNLSDLTVERGAEQSFPGYEEAMAQLEALPHVLACSPRLEGLALVKLGDRDAFRWAQFTGIELEREGRTTELLSYWQAAQDEEKDRSRASTAKPTWGTVGTETVCPAIVGTELVVLGRDLEGNVHSLGLGDKIVLVTAAQNVMDRELLPCAIAGKFKSGMYEYDQRNLYIPLDRTQKFLKKGKRVTSIAMRLDDYANASQVRAAILGTPTLDELMRFRRLLRSAARKSNPPASLPHEDIARDLQRHYYEWQATANPLYIGLSLGLARAYVEMADELEKAGAPQGFSRRDELTKLRATLEERRKNSLGPDYRVLTWEDKQRNFLRAIGIERKINVVIQSFLFLLAWVLIYSILSSSVVEKTKDIGILRSLGCTRAGIMSIFLLNGFIVGLAGSVVGTLGGVIFCNNINEIADQIYKVTKFRVFPPDIYYLDKIPVDRDPTGWVIIITCVAMVVSLLAALYPAYKAARLNPVESLRYE